MGIVLLGGLSDPALRLPYHNSAGICYSLADRESVAERVRNVALEHSREIYLLKVAAGARVIQTGDSNLKTE